VACFTLVKYFKSPQFHILLPELLFNAIHMPPGLDYEFTYSNQGKEVRYSMDSLVTFLMLIRIYLVLRLITKFSRWRNKNAQRICSREGIEADTIFALKCLMQEAPYTVLFTNFMISSLIFGFAVRTVERVYYEDEATGRIFPTEDSYQDYTFMWNGWWLIVVTMTTVGFGDFFAKTYLGRAVSIIACFYGVFLVSLMVVTLARSSEMNI